MVKECPVILNNEAVTVVRYGEVNVQFPSIKKDAKTVFVDYIDGRYIIVDGKQKNTNVPKNSKKKNVAKKTTVENDE